MTESVGGLLRYWRQHRRLSQLALSASSGVSTRHLSYLETGRARPTAVMILRLCDHLQVPLREQNRMLHAAGFAPAHPEHAVGDAPMHLAAEAIDAVLTGHLPCPALVLDGGWDLIAANEALTPLLHGVDPHLLEPPVNVLRLTLHPQGLAPRIVNNDQWRAHLLRRLHREHQHSGDPRLAALLAQVGSTSPAAEDDSSDLLVPLCVRVGGEVLSLLSTTTVFGTPREVTLSELAIEAFYPADQHTRTLLASGLLSPERTGR